MTQMRLARQPAHTTPRRRPNPRLDRMALAFVMAALVAGSGRRAIHAGSGRRAIHAGSGRRAIHAGSGRRAIHAGSHGDKVAA